MNGTTFIAIYRGETITDAKLVAVTANKAIVNEIVHRMIESGDLDSDETDPVLDAIQGAKLRALRLIRLETSDE